MGTIRQYSVAVISALHEFVVQGYSKLSQLKGFRFACEMCKQYFCNIIIMEHTPSVSHTGIVKISRQLPLNEDTIPVIST